jgi:hypothetical protein
MQFLVGEKVVATTLIKNRNGDYLKTGEQATIIGRYPADPLLKATVVDVDSPRYPGIRVLIDIVFPERCFRSPRKEFAISINAWATALVGCAIDADKLEMLDKKPCCSNPDTAGKGFCGNCGRPPVVEFRRLIDGCTPKSGGPLDVQTFQGLSVFHSKQSGTFIGKFVKTAGFKTDSKAVRLPIDFDFMKFKADMKKKLQDVGLWKEEMFGVWAINEAVW